MARQGVSSLNRRSPGNAPIYRPDSSFLIQFLLIQDFSFCRKMQTKQFNCHLRLLFEKPALTKRAVWERTAKCPMYWVSTTDDPKQIYFKSCLLLYLLWANFIIFDIRTLSERIWKESVPLETALLRIAVALRRAARTVCRGFVRP